MSEDADLAHKRIYKRAVVAYSGGVGMVLFALAISILRGAGWKPVLVLIPLYIVVFGGITYQLVKELHALKSGCGNG